MKSDWRLDQPKAQAQLAEAIKHLDEGIAIMDADGSIDYVNPAFEKIFGITAEEAVGASFSKTVYKCANTGAAGELWSAVSNGRSWRGSLKTLSPDNVTTEVLVKASPIRPEGNVAETTGYIAIIRDISGERHLEEQLRHAHKLEAIGTLAGGIAHDFNNILSAVLGFAELSLMDAPEGSELAENISEVLTAGRRARDLVRQLLTFSRQSESKAQPFIARPVVNETLKLLRSSLPSTIDIRRNLASEAAIFGDPMEVHQVLMNLCTNSALAMRQGGGTLTVELKNVEVDEEKAAEVPGLSPGSHLMLLVGDTGVGMIPEVAERVFDPFFTTRKEGEGHGLGLSTAHGMVTSAGGAIEVESAVGVGSVFRVYWPRIEPEQFDGEIVCAALPTGTERVLFVDDEEIQVALARKMLGTLGYEVTALPSPVEALKLFSENPEGYDLVVTDITMPRLTGIDFARELLKIRPDLPIIMCTGYSELITSEKPENYGVKALVAKPVVMREMAETIRRVLDAAGAGR